MRVLVTGASSLPGYRLVVELVNRGYDVVGVCYRHEIPLESDALVKVAVDVRDYGELVKLFDRYRPDVVVHMAAYGDVDGCERDRRLAWDVNVGGTLNVVRLANVYSEYVVYLSTDYIFDGEGGGYREFDPPNPVNYYGLTKLCGEVAVSAFKGGSSIVRASSIYGIGPGRRNFAKFLVERLGAGEPVRALTDQYTTPTQASLLAEALVEIIENRYEGVFHVVGEKFSRYEFAVKIAEAFGFNKSLIGKASISEFNWLARRPKDSSLNCEHTRKILRTDFYSTGRALEAIKREFEEFGVKGL